MLPDELLREFKELRREVNKLKLFDIPKKSDLGGGGGGGGDGGYVPPNYDLTYLRLDASNDPVTADLDVNSKVIGRGHGNGEGNLVVGQNSLQHASADDYAYLLAVGGQALWANTSGTYNVGIGFSALFSNTVGDKNEAFGNYALSALSSTAHIPTVSDENIGFGYNAGNHKVVVDAWGDILASANQSIFIGNETKAHDDIETNQIVIGYAAEGAGSNTVVIGNASITQTVLRGILTTAAQAIHKVFIGPVSGADAAPTFRVLDVTDIPAHNILSSTHGDVLAGSVLDGSLIIGNVTPKWSTLAISIPAANVRNVLGIDNGETRPSWKTALDATNPATLTAAGAAAAGASLVFSHRDHVHPITSSSNPGAAASLLASDSVGNLTLTMLTVAGLINMKNYTVATLPAGTQGDICYCTDLLLPGFLAIAVGGGAVVGPVFKNATQWVSF